MDAVRILFRKHYEAIIRHVMSKNVTPLLCTLHPNVRHSSDYTKKVNNYIRNFGHQVIQFDKALSANNEGIILDPDLFMNDGVHPNITGHQLMYERVLKDVPGLYS